ncbi:MAG: hypothetical protein H0W96_05240, partial [Solirubrobacterales bacterium]|nr:hypothetical protein [Solirubrobacterales bacterium]
MAAAPARALELPGIALVPGLPTISNLVSVPGLPAAPVIGELPTGPM